MWTMFPSFTGPSGDVLEEGESSEPKRRGYSHTAASSARPRLLSWGRRCYEIRPRQEPETRRLGGISRDSAWRTWAMTAALSGGRTHRGELEAQPLLYPLISFPKVQETLNQIGG
ncbi:hypothetical protein NHX12_019904 [Muraenolepis orangiensis]|uniref:Uncharacterized protein n=1 Tax=Muraenolepis orangiensis TaxID=630683 RepID=A0A9Q0EWB1_9TELE|nr:hypothetical protein NHX12_019904 [Muraenolepis orangiensis]